MQKLSDRTSYRSTNTFLGVGIPPQSQGGLQDYEDELHEAKEDVRHMDDHGRSHMGHRNGVRVGHGDVGGGSFFKGLLHGQKRRESTKQS